jgi:hypothetical protein
LINYFENRVLRRIFVPKRDEVTGEWRRLHNEERYALYIIPDTIRVINPRRLKWAEHVAHMRDGRGAYRFFGEKSEDGRPLGTPRRKWDNNIKMDL